jgi:N-acetyl-anhydromuramyl-L-alanine amidase AmpD
MTGDGWMPSCDRIQMVPERYATNVGLAEGQMKPQAIVDHVMGGHYAYALEMMLDPTVGDDADDYASWHFSIAQDGRIAQHASIFTPCMGAGLRSADRTDEPITTFRKRWGSNPNSFTVHIEHEDHAVRPAVFTEEQIEASIRVHRFVWESCDWLKALPRGFWWLPDTADGRFTYHSQIDPVNRADDPGANFPWNRVVEATLSPAEPAVPPPPDDFQRGRREMFNEWVRATQRYHDDVVTRADAHLAWVKSREQEWGIQ